LNQVVHVSSQEIQPSKVATPDLAFFFSPFFEEEIWKKRKDLKII